jgi:hypothetical protein
MTEHDDDFLARVKADAAPLRYQPDQVALARMRARIRERVAAPPTVAQVIASWFRPLAAAVAIVAIAAGVGLVTIDTAPASVDSVEIVVGGETYVVGD